MHMRLSARRLLSALAVLAMMSGGLVAVGAAGAAAMATCNPGTIQPVGHLALHRLGGADDITPPPPMSRCGGSGPSWAAGRAVRAVSPQAAASSGTPRMRAA
jgi:hypothetical protein